jgi:hypothetical protein
MYPYLPLSEDRNDVRILHIHPGAFEDDICCTLQHAELNRTLVFTALSYTWGDPKVRKPILVDGHSLDVTINLYDAIQHLRDTHASQAFWIDAVCINQNDIDERNKQVLRMRDIYAMASDVKVWLGIGDNDDTAAMALIARLASIVHDPEEALSQGFNAEYQEHFLDEFEKADPVAVKALADLFHRPWWTRIWVVQELCLARQNAATVTCGRNTVLWLQFLVAAYAIDLSWFIVEAIVVSAAPEKRLSAFNQGIRMAQCRRVNRSDPGFTLLELLNQHRDCEATDPRDKFFGLLGLSGDADGLGIIPNYTLSPEEIFTDLFHKHVTATRSLDIICSVKHPRNFDNMPSWVPDWSTDQITPGICVLDRYVGGNDFPGSPMASFQKFAASGSSSTEILFSGRTMSIRAIRFGDIAYLSDVDDGMSFDDIDTFGRSDKDGKSGSDSKTFNQWFNMILDDHIFEKIQERYGAENVIDAFIRTLIGNRNTAMTEPVGDTDAEMNVDR